MMNPPRGTVPGRLGLAGVEHEDDIDILILEVEVDRRLKRRLCRQSYTTNGEADGISPSSPLEMGIAVREIILDY